MISLKFHHVATCMFLFLSACGGSDDAGGTGNSTASTARVDRVATNTMVNEFGFHVSGDVEIQSTYAYEKLSLVGGCHSVEGFGIGFIDSSTAGQENWFLLQLEGDQAPASGESGSFELGKIQWTNGHSRDPEIGVLLPNTFEGTGTLIVDEHSGRGMAGQMAGSVTAELSNAETDETVSIDVTFDINLACAG